MLEDLEITVNNHYALGERGSKLFGAIIAIKETPGLLKASFTDRGLLEYFNSHFNKSFKDIVKETEGYKIGYDDAKRFLRRNKGK